MIFLIIISRMISVGVCSDRSPRIYIALSTYSMSYGALVGSQ